MKPEEKVDLDEILKNFGLGPYQVTICILMGFVLMFSNLSPLSYAITAGDMKYRCEIPQCDDLGDATTPFNPSWLKSAVPYDDDNVEPEKCMMYSYIEPQNNNTDNRTCGPMSFNKNSTVLCDKWVYGETEKTIVNDFSITCDENKWKLSMVGTVNSIGQFIGIPLAGIISDKYGRKFILVTGSILSAIFGTLRSFTNDYLLFLLLEFVDSFASSGVYGATFVLGMEFVSPSARVTTSSIMSAFYPMGSVFMGFVSYMFQDWRIMLRIVYLPGFLIFGYIWWVPESMRWLQSQNRVEEMTNILSKIAKSNGKTLPPNVLNALALESSKNKNVSPLIKKNRFPFANIIRAVFSSKKIFLQLVNCSFCWTTITLNYYGLSLTSTEFYGNKYFNFILVNAIEVPGCFISWYIMDNYSRRSTQSASFLLSGVGCILINLIPTDHLWMKLIFFMSVKLTVSIAFNILYVYTAEMFPTKLRMTLFGVASMFGRFGTMLAPQMSLLSNYFGEYVPIMLFGITSFIAGMLTFLFPETKDKKLSDLQDAKSDGDI